MFLPIFSLSKQFVYTLVRQDSYAIVVYGLQTAIFLAAERGKTRDV